MEDAVAERVELEVVQRVRRRGRTDHVMPLQDLVEDDPIEEPTESYAQHDGGDDQPPTIA